MLSSPFSYALFKTTPTWVDIDMVDITVTGDFYVVIYTASSAERGIQVGFDTSVENRHSEIALGRRVITDWNQVNWKLVSSTPLKRERTNWMMRVIGSAPTTLTKTLYYSPTATSSQTLQTMFLGFLDLQLIQMAVGAATGASIIFGWLFKTKKRRFVSSYLKNVDSVWNSNSTNSEECRKQLKEMKDEVLRLFEKGKIDESQFSVLDAKLERHLKDLN